MSKLRKIKVTWKPNRVSEKVDGRVVILETSELEGKSLNDALMRAGFAPGYRSAIESAIDEKSGIDLISPKPIAPKKEEVKKEEEKVEQPVIPMAASPSKEEEKISTVEVKLEDKNMRELRNMAKERKVKNYSRMNKETLIKALS